MLAPPWLPVPPRGYGGVEEVVALLCDGLVAAGHEVTLFAAPGSETSATVRPLLEHSHPDEIGAVVHEADHVGRAFALLAEQAKMGHPFDVLHDHSGFVALAMADLLTVPAVHTLHGPFTARTEAFYRRHGRNATIVAISLSQARQAPRGVHVEAVVPNPIAVADWPFYARKNGYLLWIGRVESVKGPGDAIVAARLAGRPLVLAGPVQRGQEDFFQTEIQPHVDGQAVRYVGEVAGRQKQELFAGASALLMPIQWEEPFGMVMVEALACGTPIVAYRRGAANEIVLPGDNGFLVSDPASMARAVCRLDEIDPARCRADAGERFDVAAVASAYTDVYRRAVSRARARTLTRTAAVAGARAAP